ncbi:type I restriction enzyme S subunit [Gelidibacter algens]|uniref:Type I restriction enzyme S subunit n=1 Tax=Gelidibacter algens TaxID=49280 RepID=A0A1A7R4U5_9FLAO|nr:restriction endonuclease subunit S [Gelidibacter algens]OBX25782.1 hypothetical protein A9996_08535 [Gelidibacter algens]RAJ21131.1 type I restriction enzyme S subunit [Gelidibacter algens]
MQLLQHFKDLTLHPKNAQEIKGLILQLAIQGKLTSNWRKNNIDIEPVSELLKKVEKEKAQLIKDKRIKVEKSLSSISKGEVPYVIPESWSWYKLAELSSINGGFAFKSANYIDDGARVIRISDFDENGFKNHKIVRHLYTNDLESYVLEDKNILIAMTGGTVGKSLFVNEVPEIMVVNQRVATIKIFMPIYEAYINCVIPTKLIQDVIEEAKNSTNDNISMSDIKGFKIPLPPLEEQKEIVRVVEILFKEVEQLEKLTLERISLKEDFVTSALQQLTTNNANQEWAYLQEHFKSFFNETKNIKKLRETVLQLAVQGKLTAHWRVNNPEREDASILLKRIQMEKAQLIKDKKIKKEKALPVITKDEIPYELPDGWVWCRIGEVSIHSLGKMLDRNKNTGTYKPYLRNQNVRWFSIDMNDVKEMKFEENEFEKFSAKKGDVLICEGGYPGRASIWDKDYPIMIQKALHRVRFIDELIDPNLFVSYLWLLDSNRSIEQYFTGAGIQHLTGQSLHKMLFPLPPFREQKAIVQNVNALMGLCDALEQEVKQSQEQSERLMQSCLREVFE